MRKALAPVNRAKPKGAYEPSQEPSGRRRLRTAALTLATMLTLSLPHVFAASCCGGGTGASLLLPKYAKVMADLSIDVEAYDGFWNRGGVYLGDPTGSDLSQFRMTLGLASRLASRWQMGLLVPWIRNDNRYPGVSSQSTGLGDMGANVWYETFDGITCVSRVNSLKDLKPAAYLGAALTVPTGISPFDDVSNSFDITGRGFYRLEGNVLVEKTIYPFNAGIQFRYGTHWERPVNREYGKYVEPYRKKLGNTAAGSLSFGYTHFLRSMGSVSAGLAYSHLWEGQGRVDGAEDPTSGFEKKSLAGTLSFASGYRDWVIRSGWSHAMKSDGWGRNFPATDTYSLGASHVFR